MKCKFTLLILILMILCSGIGHTQVKLPADHFVAGWIKTGPSRQFVKNDLYGYINGGAELFHEFGFDTLLVQIYGNEGKELGIDLYQMESPEAALGIYLMKRGEETPDSLILTRNSSGPYQITALKGCCFIILNNLSGDANDFGVMRSLANRVIAQLPEETETELLRDLPKANMVTGSELIVRGPFALQSVYTFGDGDMLKLGGRVYGVLADYKSPETGQFTLLSINYPDSIAAASVYIHLLENLDPYLTILEADDQSFLFADYRDEFGAVRVSEAHLEIRIHLREKPGIDFEPGKNKFNK